MLQRKQVLFHDWLWEYLKNVAETCGVSTSDIIRAHSCITTILTIERASKRYRPPQTFKKILRNMSECSKGNKAFKKDVLKNLEFLNTESQIAIKSHREEFRIF